MRANKIHCLRKVAIIVLLSFTMFIFQTALFAMAELNLLGQVTVVGKAEVMIEEQNWFTIERVYPVTPESRYRTADGRLSFELKDETRLEMGNQSEIIINGSIGAYSLELIKGEMAFRVPEGSYLLIKIPDSRVEVFSSKKDTIGSVYCDENNIKIINYSGGVMIKTPTGEDFLGIEEGSLVTISTVSPNKRKYEISSIKNAKGEGIGNVLLFGGIGALAVGGAAIAIGSGGGDGEVASPSSP